MTDTPRFTNAQKAAEASWEVHMRYKVYARNAGGIDKISASDRRRIDIMAEIEEEYTSKAEKQPDLFGGSTHE